MFQKQANLRNRPDNSGICMDRQHSMQQLCALTLHIGTSHHVCVKHWNTNWMPIIS